MPGLQLIMRAGGLRPVKKEQAKPTAYTCSIPVICALLTWRMERRNFVALQSRDIFKIEEVG